MLVHRAYLWKVEATFADVVARPDNYFKIISPICAVHVYTSYFSHMATNIPRSTFWALTHSCYNYIPVRAFMCIFTKKWSLPSVTTSF